MSDRASRVVERLLAERIGLDPSSVGEGLINRGVKARMMALGLRDRAEYEHVLLRQTDDELQALVEEVVVPESWFFRDERPFEVLADFAREGWLNEPKRPPLAALSLPCAGGEEPYSIAMTLRQLGLSGDRFRVEAVDISARNVARAIAGVYGSNSFRGTPAPWRSHFFREHNGVFTLDLAIRSTVHFHLGNLLDPALFADHPSFDVVFCRNLLIYLDEGARARAFASLGRLVVEGGLLFLGHADRIEQPEGLMAFEATGDKGAFAFRKGPVKAKKPAGSRLSPSPLAGKGASRVQPGLRSPVPNVAGGTKLPISLNIPRQKGRDSKSKLDPAPDAVVLDQASALADLGRHDEATALVERVIAAGGASARAHFLLGLIAQAAGLRDRAEAHYLKAIYLDPGHDEALLALALLARRKGDLVGEATYRRRAERVLARKVTPS